ncbi:hypothetical protein [Rugamonas rivuli]|uniref:Alpha/beta hydrolase n=1 Tax=Rugamonas rivuli TaxID=2743358 RepID=A0A843SDT8_9BURK|nr:hypothetical protein [Rugamonas rivuli]MQA22715.1 hypothetical protein [Rugamonas rivuli]
MNLDTGINTTVEVYFPISGKPKALVIAVPGTGGLSDPYFDRELGQSAFMPDSRGGTTAALVNAGYGVAFYSQRGFRQLRTCVAGDTAFERAVSYVEHCIDEPVRAGVTLATITNDTETIFRALSRHPATSTFEQIALAWSEGSYHAATLIGASRIDTRKMVTIGGPVESMSATFEYQLTRQYYFDLADAAFQKCNQTSLTMFELFRCGQVQITQQKHAWAREMADGDVLVRENIPQRKIYFSNFYLDLQKQFASFPRDTAMNGTFRGINIQRAWAAAYYDQVFSSKTKMLENIGKSHGAIGLIYGAADNLVRLPNDHVCSNAKAAGVEYCAFLILPKLGHGLEDGNEKVSSIALDAVVKTIDSIWMVPLSPVN